jgi:hypothetical protein
MATSTAPTRIPDTDEIVAQYLTARKGEWEYIAVQSGVSYSWISKFMNSKIPNPGSQTLKKLRTWLEANPPTSRPHSAHAGAETTGSGTEPSAT